VKGRGVTAKGVITKRFITVAPYVAQW